MCSWANFSFHFFFFFLLLTYLSSAHEAAFNLAEKQEQILPQYKELKIIPALKRNTYTDTHTQEATEYAGEIFFSIVNTMESPAFT